MKKPLVLNIPSELASALSRRHYGREDITREEILEAISKMNLLWALYEKANAQLEYCEGEWWDKMEIERHFMRRRWYYGHAKRKKLMEQVKDLHKQMFYLMTATDGNYEHFGSDAMYAEDIHFDFTTKYLKRLEATSPIS